MEKKLQELTEKIYSEGVEKAKIEADDIVKEAKGKAEKELNNAQNEAKKIIEDANKKSDEIKRNGESEMKLAAKQALSEVKQKITEIITTGVISENVKTTMDDKDFVKGLIESSIKSLSSEGATDYDWSHSKLRKRLRNNRMPPGIPFMIDEGNRDGGDVVLSAAADGNDIALGGQFSVSVGVLTDLYTSASLMISW